MISGTLLPSYLYDVLWVLWPSALFLLFSPLLLEGEIVIFTNKVLLFLFRLVNKSLEMVSRVLHQITRSDNLQQFY